MSETHAPAPLPRSGNPAGSPPAPPDTPPAAGRRRQHRDVSRRAPRSPEAQRLLCLAVLPPALVTVLATALVAHLLTSGQPLSSDAPRIPAALTAAALLLAAAVVAAAAAAAHRETRERAARVSILRREVARTYPGLRGVLTRVADDASAVPPEQTPAPVRAVDSSGADQLDCLRREIVQARHAARLAVTEAAATAGRRAQLSDNRAEMIATLAARLQHLVHREIGELDRVQRNIEDPALLDGFFRVDHLATRVRRHAENLVVLGGGDTRRQWNRPVAMSELLRSASAEVQHYARITPVPPYEGAVHGHAAADVIHLLAELLENATVFSSPDTEVLLRSQRVASGVAIEVEDRGTGMDAAEREQANALLAHTAAPADTDRSRAGRIGLRVVSALARRHGITVQLRGNIYGGVQAVLVLPDRLVCGTEPRHPAAAAPPEAATTSAGAPTPGRPAATQPTSPPATEPTGPPGPHEIRRVPGDTAARRPLPRRTTPEQPAGEVRCAPPLEYSVVLGGARPGTPRESLATVWTGADWTEPSPN